MAGDYSRKSFDALRDYVGVLMQQGHPMGDWDWNELVSVLERRVRAETVDTLGRAVVPRETPLGFEINPTVLDGTPSLTIGRGRMYVDGHLVENHGAITDADSRVFDRARFIDGQEVGVLDELISREEGDFLDYFSQPYYPNPPSPFGPNGDVARALVYLDVWKREVTPLKDMRLLEPALNGVDTTTRLQTVWQVKALAVGDDVNCSTPDEDISEWMQEKAASPVRLTSGTIEFEDPEEPCLIPPGGGYRGLENQLYRVELHDGGTELDGLHFKWSRENASVGARVEAIEDAGTRVQVRRIGRDTKLSFDIGDWVEVIDEESELHGRTAPLLRVVDVLPDTRELVLSAAIPIDMIPTGDATPASRNLRVVRWDQGGQVLLADGSNWVNLDDDSNAGLIPVPTDGSAVVLEHGVTVAFSIEDFDGRARAGDHWCFAARTAGAQIEVLEQAPPKGIHHHIARLAVVTPDAVVADCRRFWPPEVATGDGCACTVCVTPESHSSGALTIQDAINQVPAAGGTVCLEAGVYVLESPVLIARRTGLKLAGQGVGTLLMYAGVDAAIDVAVGTDVEIEDLSIVGFSLPNDEGIHPCAIRLANTLGCSVERVFAMMFGVLDFQPAGIGLEGFQFALALEDNIIIAAEAIANTAGGRKGSPAYLLLAETRITDSVLFGIRQGISLGEACLHVAATRIANNLVLGAGGAAVALTGVGLPTTALTIDGNTLMYAGIVGVGVETTLVNVRVQDNDILGSGEERGPGILLSAGVLANQRLDAQLIGNRIAGASHGIRIDGNVDSLLAKRNVIRDCVEGAISMGPEASARRIAIDNNVIERIGHDARLGDQALAALRLANVEQAQVVGNTIDKVGEEGVAAAYWVGIEAIGVQVFAARGNTLSGIGPARTGAPVFGIQVRAPYAVVDVSNNQVLGQSVATAAGHASFAAIAIGEDPRGKLPEDLQAIVFLILGTESLWMGQKFLGAFGAVREAEVAVSNNQITDGRNSADPWVWIRRGRQPIGSCSLASNQVRVFGEASENVMVEVLAPRVVAANNIVRRDNERVAMRIDSLGGKTTIIGNLTSGDIDVQPGGMPAAFAPLNLIA
jgi:hypothetical protein